MAFERTRRLLLWCFVLLAAGALAAAGLLFRGGKEAPPVRPIPKKAIYDVGLLQGDSVPEQDRLRAGFLAALAADGWEEGKNLRIEFLSGGGNAGALAEAAGRFKKEKKDLVAVIGAEAAEAAADSLRATPVVGAGVLNFAYAPWLEGHRNFTGVMSLPEVVQQLDAARRILRVKRMAVLYSAEDTKAAAQLQWLRAAAGDMKISLVEAPVPKDTPPEDAARALAGRADAAYVAIDGRMQHHFDGICAALREKGIPVVGSDDEMVRRGAVLAVSEDYYRMGFAAGKMAAKLLRGDAVPEELPITRQKDPDLVVNMAAASLFQAGLPGELWQKAKKLYLYDGQPARP